MKAIIETSTGRAFYLIKNSEDISLTANYLQVGKRKSHDISSNTHEIINIEKPAKWIGGGVLKISGGAWVVNDQAAYDKVIDDEKLAAVNSDLQSVKLLKAFILALNDGTFVPNSNYTLNQIRNGLKNRIN